MRRNSSSQASSSIERSRRIGDFVAQIVRPAAIRVHVVKMLVQVPRQQPRNHIEIFVVVRRKPARVALGFFDGAQPSARKVARNFKFRCGQHGALSRARADECLLRE